MLKFCFFLFILTLASSAFAAPWVFKTAAQDSSPKYFEITKQYKKEVHGYCVDVLRSMEALDSTLKFEGDQKILPFSRMLRDLEKGSLDVFCGLQRNQDREGRYIFFDEPLLFLQGKLIVLDEDVLAPTSWKELQLLKGSSTVLTIKGTASADYAKSALGLKVDDSPLTIDQALKMLVGKRGRFVFYHDLAVIDAVQRLGLEKKVRILPTDFYSEGQYFVVSKSLPKEKVRRLRSAYKKLSASGKLREILNKYPNIRQENLSPQEEESPSGSLIN